MPKYEVILYYTGFLTRVVVADNEQSAVLKARDELNNPCNCEMFRRNFDPILETLSSWHEGDSARLINQ